MKQFDQIKDFLIKWFKGPLGLGEFREVFYSIGDPSVSKRKWRGVVRYIGFEQLLDELAPYYRRLNLFIGIGFVKPEHAFDDLSPKYLLYDRIVYDFDNKEDPSKGVEAALFFAERIKDAYGADSVVYTSGFRGAHLAIPLAKPTDWEGYGLTWKALLNLLPHEYREMVDYNMLQYNRVDRAPFTWNNKQGKRAYTRIITPKILEPSDFSWSYYEPLDLSKIVVYKPVLPSIKAKKIIMLGRKPSWKWVLEIAYTGLPDGRKRFIFYVLTPYMTLNNIPEEQAYEIIQKFIESSCKNMGACGKIYDSWIRSELRGAYRKHVKPWSLRIMKEKDPELYQLVINILESSKRQVARELAKETGFEEHYSTLLEFINDTGLQEFGYEDLKKWLESKYGSVDARTWHNWERILRLMAEKGLLGRKYWVNGEWIDIGPGKIEKPPSKKVRFYIISNKNPIFNSWKINQE